LAHTPKFRFVSYDTGKYPFADILAKTVFHVADLSRLHEKHGTAGATYDDNMALRELLNTMDEKNEFHPVYEAFMREVINVPLFYGYVKLVPPVFRVQMAHSNSVSAWHRDVDVTGYGRMITAWIPFVDTSGSNTIWVETEYGKQDYTPVPVRYGEILLFDSAWLWHGSVSNDTEMTRVSMDARMIPPTLKRRKIEIDLGIFAPRPEWCVDANAAVHKNREAANLMTAAEAGAKSTT